MTVEKTQESPRVVLHPEVHKRIIEDMERVCEIANVPASFVRHSMKSFCQETEIEWVRSFNIHRKNGEYGLLITGTDKSETRCMAIVGTLVRNFIDARIMTLSSVITDPEEAKTPTVLVIPNLYMSSFGKQFTAWQIQSVYDVLLNRLTTNKPTVVCVESITGLETSYGSVFAEHIKQFQNA